ncbi:VanZ family protein [Cellulomonas humilata]|uniref:VanZ-like domain-containing protein n=1 Tax=Cellulomonas humilata TaxID=144055 RepID=A0ABU0EA16_9CELL|nr:VanZ family protein [Cellulomonas humilata]MDQ0372104.1 hypothetical protein [Cellulomonas humilata]
MDERQRRVVIGLLVGVLVVAAVLVLNPWHLHDAFDAPIARGLGALHDRGLPEKLNLHAAEFAANIALFVPLGLLGALLLPRRRWWVVFVALVALSLGIELVQAVGLSYRQPSTRDVLGNSLGAAIGVGLSLALRRQPATLAERS